MPRRFFIIDGHAQIFRAYFAPFRDLTSPDGEPTKATFVFAQMLLNLVIQQRPDYLAMVIDSGDEAVFRKAIFPEYKANRKAKPDDFEPQERRILDLVRQAGVPLFAKGGFEADDLIATMTQQLIGSDIEVIIVSKDKDLRQLMGPGVQMYDVQINEFTDPATMEAACGYGPDKVIEIQTLTGDTIDNVPGIPGVGEKTAAKLISLYGTAEGVLANADKLTPKMKENILKAGPEALKLSRQLVTLKRDVQMDFDLQQCKFEGLNAAALRPTLQALGFTSLLGKLQSVGKPGKSFAPAPSNPSPASPAFTRPVASNIAKPRKPQPAADGQMSLFGSFDPAPETSTPAIESSESPAESGENASVGLPSAYTSTLIPPATSSQCTYRCVRTEADLAELITSLKQAGKFAFDTETDGLGAMRSELVGMSFSHQAETGWYVPVAAPEGQLILPRQQVLDALRPVLEDPSIGKLGHNIKYDLLAMRKAGIRLRGVIMDTMISAFLLDAGQLQYGIDRLALQKLNFQKIPTSDLIGKGKSQITMDRVPLETITQYAAEDADIAWRLAELFWPQLAQEPAIAKLADELETPLIDVLVDMEEAGIGVDPAVLKMQSQVLGERIDKLRDQIHEQSGMAFNIDSTRQLAEVLFDKLSLKSVKKTKTGHSTDVEVLEKLAPLHPVPKLVLEYRTLVKLKNTYLDNLTDFINPQTGRIHASFNQIGAATGRLSCSDPNLQNIPIRTDEGRRIRMAFVPEDPANNVLLTADYSQIELRVLAHFTREPALVRAFAAGDDIHQIVAAEVFGVPLDQVTKDQRSQAKIVNFGIIYGVSAFGLARRIEGMSVPAAAELIAAYNKRFPAIEQFLNQCVMEAQATGAVRTILGRRRPVHDIHSGVLAQRNAAERIAINSVVQGSAADLIKVAMLNIHRKITTENLPCRMLIQVHDELVFQCPDAAIQSTENLVKTEMIAAGEQIGLSVPLAVESGWGRNWQELK